MYTQPEFDALIAWANAVKEFTENRLSFVELAEHSADVEWIIEANFSGDYDYGLRAMMTMAKKAAVMAGLSDDIKNSQTAEYISKLLLHAPDDEKINSYPINTRGYDRVPTFGRRLQMFCCLGLNVFGENPRTGRVTTLHKDHELPRTIYMLIPKVLAQHNCG